MNKTELKKVLDELGINPMYYSLDGELKESSLVLFNYYGNWRTYYLERGQEVCKQIFLTEEDACNYMYEELKKQKQQIESQKNRGVNR